MKTKLIKGKVDILLVGGIPSPFEILRISLPVLTIDYPNGDTSSYLLPDGDWKFISRIKDLTEEQAKSLVKSFDDDHGRPICFENYLFADHPFISNLPNTAKGSFESLLEVNKITEENEYEYRPSYWPDGAWYNSPIELYNAQRRYDKAEENVFSKDTLIFIKL